MPRFYLDVVSDGVLARDEEGQELADHKAAREEAAAALIELARCWPSLDMDRHKLVVSVQDASGKAIFTTTLSLDVEWNG